MKKSEEGNVVNSKKKISPTTSFLLNDIKRLKGNANDKKISEASLIEKYALIKKGKKLYANSFIVVEEGFKQKIFRKYGVLSNIQKGNTYTALIPINEIEALSQNKYVKYIQIGEKVKLAMDVARTSTYVNQVHTGTSLPKAYFGEGVVVGIIDGGFDYTHPNFYNSTGTSGYRVKRVWEQSATSGTPPTGYSYGRELTTTTSILAAQRDVTNQSHGTHVAGIAAGAGGGASTTYTGVAPKSDLVFVSTNFSDLGILSGIDYIQKYAKSVGKPSVINMSLGNHTGPHDGSSLFDKMCDSFFVGEGKILVGSAGNEGGDPLHISKSFTSSDTILYTFIEFPSASKFTNGLTFVDIWGEVGDNFYAGAYIYNTTTNLFEDATPFLYSGAITGSYSHTLYDDDPFFSDACDISINTGIDPINNKPRVTLQIDNTDQDDNYRYVLLEVRAKSTNIKMWADDTKSFPGKAWFVNNGYSAAVLAGSTNSTMGEIGGTGKNIISVGAYNTNATPTGAIASFSSKGPTADGRTKPDITAPGNRITSSVNRFDAEYLSGGGGWSDVVTGVSVGSTSWWYAKMQGTSMAAPMVTGIIALWLEMYPDLSPSKAKEIINAIAIKDAFTGTIGTAGSNTWGWGKINAWNNLPYLLPAKPTVTPSIVSICDGESRVLSAPSGFAAYKWNNGATTSSITVSSAGNYKVKVTNSAGFNSVWSDSAVVTVNPLPTKPTISQVVDTLYSSSPTGNQWYFNGVLISGATDNKLIIGKTGDYKVVVSNSFGCINESFVLNTTPTNIGAIKQNLELTIYPNPANDFYSISFDKNYDNVSCILYDNTGKIVLSNQFDKVKQGEKKEFRINHLSSGIYQLNVTGNNLEYLQKISVLR